MKKIFSYLLLSVVSANLSAQTGKADSLVNIISVSMNDSVRIDAMVNLFDLYQSNSSDSNMFYARKILQIGQERKINSIEAFGYSEVGYVYYRIDNKAKGYEYVLKALKIAEPYNNPRILAKVYNNLALFKSGSAKIADHKKAVSLWKAAGNSKNFGLHNLANAYRAEGQLDSALTYATSAYDVARKNHPVAIPWVLLLLGHIHEGLDNPELSLTYYRLALEDAKKKNSTRLVRGAYIRLASLYKQKQMVDSNFHYSKKAYDIAFSETISWIIDPAYSLYEIYTKQNKTDSALKYLNIYVSAKDSLNTIQEAQKVQSLDFDEQLRQRENAATELKAKEERKHNLQYAAIALGIVMFVILFFVLSHSIVANQNLIRFLGILALLIVFEFLNLFLHPFLDRITNHQPVLMLAAMVCIAALLIPLHHKLEHWITHKMVEKNKKIRLAAAKKTIATLENN
jgi:hypothetical protein